MMGEPTTEAQLEQYLRSKIRERGGLVVKIAPVIAGVPDDLVVLPGNRLLLVELKKKGGVLRPVQAAFHRRLRGLGVTVHVLRGLAEVDRWLSTLDEPGYPITRRTLAHISRE